jgi:hypothetical protein
MGRGYKTETKVAAGGVSFSVSLPVSAGIL